MVCLKGCIFWTELNDCCKMLCFHEKRKKFIWDYKGNYIEGEIVVCASPLDKAAAVVGL